MKEAEVHQVILLKVRSLSRNELIKVALCSCLLFFSLRLTNLWIEFSDTDIKFSHLYYDAESWTISFEPIKPYTYSYKWHISYLSDKLRPLIYLIVWSIAPKFNLFNRFNLIYLYAGYEVSLILDYYLFFNQFPFRVLFNSIIIVIQSLYLIHCTLLYFKK